MFFSNLAGSFGDGLYAFIMPYYMTESLKANPVEVGILYATANIFAALTLLIAGVFADKYDRKKILILGWLAWVPAPLIFAFARDWVQMLPGMALWGVWLGPPTSTAYIVTTVDKGKLTLTFTALSSAWSLGYIFSPALGGYLAKIMSMQLVFFLAFVFYALAGVLLFFIRSQVPAKLTKHVSEKIPSMVQLLKNRKLLAMSAFLGTSMFAILLFRPFIPTFLAEVYGYKSFEIGILGSFAFFGSAILGITLGRVGDKSKKSYALAAALALAGSSLVLLLSSGNFQILLLTHVFVGASYLAWPLMNAIIGPCAPEFARALYTAIPQTVGMFSAILAPYLGGVLYEASPYYPFMFGIAVTFSLALLALVKLLD
jgi:MFS family permease